MEKLKSGIPDKDKVQANGWITVLVCCKTSHGYIGYRDNPLTY
ncbi:hypothetical protein [Candidatus Bealeia paramacronuclearis]